MTDAAPVDALNIDVDNMALRKQIQELDETRRKLLDAAQPNEDAVLAHDDINEIIYRRAWAYDDEGQCECCVLTGLPILIEDEIVSDSEGRCALVAAIPQWPEFTPEEDEDEDESDEIETFGETASV